MRESRNPFSLRASEHIETEETFIRLFSPDVLEILHNDEIWAKPQIIRSAPGGGKTSLFRMFTPHSLLAIHALRKREYSRDLYLNLKDIGAVNENGPCVLGVLLNCSQSYATLEDLDIDPARKKRLLFSLLNARFVISVLQGALLLQGLSFPEDLSLIQINLNDNETRQIFTSKPSNGQGLYDWAKMLEKSVCDTLDSFSPLTNTSLPGHESLVFLNCLTADSIKYNGRSIDHRVLLMIDDVHRLTSNQRRFLLEEIISNRLAVNVWIAERLEALDIDELLSSGALSGRDYERVITVENYWSSYRKRFEKVVTNIADRRARDTKDVEIGSFSECLLESLDGMEWGGKFQKGAEIVKQRVEKLTMGINKYDKWIKERNNFEGTPRDIAFAWRSLEILIQRDYLKSQQTFDFVLEIEEFINRESSSVKAAAELFFCQEFNIPYYHGLNRLALMSSSNIEQFLWLAGEYFEEVVSAILLKKHGQLNPIDQERILKKAIKDKWGVLPQEVRHGSEVKMFLDSVGKFAKWETFKPNAPYAPGVTGIAISMADRERLSKCSNIKKDDRLIRLSNVLSACIAHNLFEVTSNQKCKGKYWMVLNLNRMLCVHFGLPLHYGGWREISLVELCKWLDKDYTPPRKNGGKYNDTFSQQIQLGSLPFL